MEDHSDNESLETMQIEMTISKEWADLFFWSSWIGDKDEEQFKVENYEFLSDQIHEYLLSDKIHIIIYEVFIENNLVFLWHEFQLLNSSLLWSIVNGQSSSWIMGDGCHQR